jgi:hypothetical protein
MFVAEDLVTLTRAGQDNPLYFHLLSLSLSILDLLPVRFPKAHALKNAGSRPEWETLCLISLSHGKQLDMNLWKKLLSVSKFKVSL